MHDIGKIAIPDAILTKPGKLTPEEWDIVKTHPKRGFEILEQSSLVVMSISAIIALTHHEKWNGRGYPEGLKGTDIHIYGRITAIADVFDALGSERCYKEAWPLDKIIALFKSETGKHFDPLLTDLFLDNLDNFLEIRDKFAD
jgi:response regulator RpfG family c-di-GMP phosphodiesterase